jgi:hypothetical protein
MSTTPNKTKDEPSGLRAQCAFVTFDPDTVDPRSKPQSTGTRNFTQSCAVNPLPKYSSQDNFASSN